MLTLAPNLFLWICINKQPFFKSRSPIILGLSPFIKSYKEITIRCCHCSNLQLVATGEMTRARQSVTYKVRWNHSSILNFNGTTIDVWEWINNLIPLFTGHEIIYHAEIVFTLIIHPRHWRVVRNTQIAKFMELTRAHLGPVGPRWAPCWPHEPCYQGLHFTADDDLQDHLLLVI